jgi:hypothetical protein
MHFERNKFPLFAHLSSRRLLLSSAFVWCFFPARRIKGSSTHFYSRTLHSNLKVSFIYRATLNMSGAGIFREMTARDTHEIDFSSVNGGKNPSRPSSSLFKELTWPAACCELSGRENL